MGRGGEGGHNIFTLIPDSNSDFMSVPLFLILLETAKVAVQVIADRQNDHSTVLCRLIHPVCETAHGSVGFYCKIKSG